MDYSKVIMDGYLPYYDFIQLYGEPKQKQLDELTQHLLKSYHMGGDKVIDSIGDGFGVGWLQVLIDHNETREEYELCSVIKEILDTYIENYGNKQGQKHFI